jgi:hypothetical protein
MIIIIMIIINDNDDIDKLTDCVQQTKECHSMFVSCVFSLPQLQVTYDPLMTRLKLADGGWRQECQFDVARSTRVWVCWTVVYHKQMARA